MARKRIFDDIQNVQKSEYQEVIENLFKEGYNLANDEKSFLLKIKTDINMTQKGILDNIQNAQEEKIKYLEVIENLFGEDSKLTEKEKDDLVIIIDKININMTRKGILDNIQNVQEENSRYLEVIKDFFKESYNLTEEAIKSELFEKKFCFLLKLENLDKRIIFEYALIITDFYLNSEEIELLKYINFSF